MKSLIEALIFASSEPVAALQIKSMVEETSTPSDQRTLEVVQIEQAVEALNAEYAAADRPYRIITVAGGYQFATQSAYAAWISRLYRDRMRRKLSQSALESLAIIAYKQPISKPEIEQIRGVNCDYVLKALLEKELVTITGRAETVGRPLLYGTTKEFLKHFGLNSITDLPRPREIEEILGENQFETERRMLEAQEAAEAQRREAEDFESRLPHIPKRKPEIPDDVEIVPKKRIRQIRVRPQAEDGSAELPFGSPAQETPAPESVEESSVAVTMALPDVPGEVEESVPSLSPQHEPAQEMPPIVKLEAAEPAAAEPDAVELAGQMPPVVKLEAVEAADVEPDAAEPAGQMPPFVVSAPGESPSDLSPAREPSGAAPDAVERVEFAPEGASTEAFPEPVPEAAASAEAVAPLPMPETAAPEPAQSAPDRTIKPPLAATPAERASAEQGHPTLWKSWKEKIQTFIRKLFG